MANKLLLVKDVDDLGRSGDVVSVKSGYARNYLIPQGFAVVASAGTLRLQQRLQEERKQRLLEERKEVEELVKHLSGVVLKTVVKVDPEGHMYGSVSSSDVVELLKEQMAFEVEKKSIQLKNPIRTVGDHLIDFKFKEDVSVSITLKVLAEGSEEKVVEQEQAQ